MADDTYEVLSMEELDQRTFTLTMWYDDARQIRADLDSLGELSTTLADLYESIDFRFSAALMSSQYE